MNILADTHAILWWLAGDERLSRTARRILENPANRRLVSIASLWETGIKLSTGKLLEEASPCASSPIVLTSKNLFRFQFVSRLCYAWINYRGCTAIHSIGC